MSQVIPSVAARCILLPADSAVPVTIPATHPLVLQTPFLRWQPTPSTGGAGGGARVAIPTWKALRAFGRRLRLSQAPADVLAAKKANPLNLALQGAMWTRLLDEYT